MSLVDFSRFQVTDLVGGYSDHELDYRDDEVFMRDLFVRGHKAAIANDVRFFHPFTYELDHHTSIVTAEVHV